MTIENVNSLLVGSLIFGVASTGVIVFTDRVIKRKSAFEISKANEEAEKAKAVAANTNERAAILEKDAAEARLETEKLKQRLAWR